MSTIKPIRTDEDLDTALARIDEIFGAEPGTPEDDELGVMLDLVELYENKHDPIGFPDPISAIKFRMDQANLTPRDLAPFIGSRAKVSEVLSGKRAITMSMARALHQHLGIPAHVLLQEPGASLPDTLPSLEYTRFPLRAMAKAGWIPDVPDLPEQAEELVTGLMERAGGRAFAAAPLYRKNDSRRVNAKTDEYALKAWCWQVMATARERPSSVAYQRGAVTPEFLGEVAQLSKFEDGPPRARDLLAGRGIGFEYLPHLRRTHLDGAAFRLFDGRPVIGMTLRHDRIDNFWFTLLHELAHVSLHLEGCGDEAAFVDDHSLRSVEAGAGSSGDSKERDADRLAGEALIPGEVWEASRVRENPSPNGVINLAQRLGIHPAIIAGRIRHEWGNYRLLSQFVGAGEVRRQFARG